MLLWSLKCSYSDLIAQGACDKMAGFFCQHFTLSHIVHFKPGWPIRRGTLKSFFVVLHSLNHFGPHLLYSEMAQKCNMGQWEVYASHDCMTIIFVHDSINPTKPLYINIHFRRKPCIVKLFNRVVAIY